MSAGYGSIPAVKAARARRAAPMLALMGLAVVAVVAVVVLTTQARAVEMVDFPQDDLGILREMVRPRPRPRPTRVLPTCVLPVHTARSCRIRAARYCAAVACACPTSARAVAVERPGIGGQLCCVCGTGLMSPCCAAKHGWPCTQDEGGAGVCIVEAVAATAVRSDHAEHWVLRALVAAELVGGSHRHQQHP